MKAVSRLAIAVILGFAGLLATSCSSDRKTVHPARGKVVDAAGKPVAGATLIFHPLDDKDDARHKPAATTDAEGNYALTTYVQDDGAPAGDYAVTVEWRPIPKSPMEPEQPDRLKGRFRDPKSSPFKATIKQGTNELRPIQLP